MFAAILPFLTIAATWLTRIGVAVLSVETMVLLTAGQKETMAQGIEEALKAGASENDIKETTAALMYEKIESEGKDPEDFWRGLSQEEQDTIKFSPSAVKRSMERTSFLGIAGAFLFIGAAVAGGYAALRGIPIGAKYIARIVAARASGASALDLMTIIEEGKMVAIGKVWVPGLVSSLLTAGGWYTSSLTNNLNDVDFWGRNNLRQAEQDYLKQLKSLTTKSAGSGSGLTSGSGPRTIIRMVEEKKPQQFLGTLFSAKLGKLEQFDRKLDDEITDMNDLEADVKININKWLVTLPGRMGYSIVIRKDPVDEVGVQQSGIWATATLHILQLSGKIMPIDTILLGPVAPAVRLELSRSTKTIETQIDGIVSAQEIREIDIPGGVVDIFSTTGERVFQNSNEFGTPSSRINQETGEIINPTPEEVAAYNAKYNTVRFPSTEEWYFTFSPPEGSYYRGPFSTEAEAWKEAGSVSSKYGRNGAISFSWGVSKSTAGFSKEPTTTPTPASTSNGIVSALAGAGNLSYGARGEAVKEIQVLLNNWGENITVDGVWGSQTDTAVRKFQSVNGLVVDAVVGPKTKEMLFLRGR